MYTNYIPWIVVGNDSFFHIWGYSLRVNVTNTQFIEWLAICGINSCLGSHNLSHWFMYTIKLYNVYGTHGIIYFYHCYHELKSLAFHFAMALTFVVEKRGYEGDHHTVAWKHITTPKCLWGPGLQYWTYLQYIWYCNTCLFTHNPNTRGKLQYWTYLHM